MKQKRLYDYSGLKMQSIKDLLNKIWESRKKSNSKLEKNLITKSYFNQQPVISCQIVEGKINTDRTINEKSLNFNKKIAYGVKNKKEYKMKKKILEFTNIINDSGKQRYKGKMLRKCESNFQMSHTFRSSSGQDEKIDPKLSLKVISKKYY